MKAILSVVLGVGVWVGVALAFPTLTWFQYIMVMAIWEANNWNVIHVAPLIVNEHSSRTQSGIKAEIRQSELSIISFVSEQQKGLVNGIAKLLRYY